MPFLNLKITGVPADAAVDHRLQRELTALMAGVLGKRAELTAVLVERVASPAWSVGGEPVRIAANLDVTVTAGTNMASEKARFIANADARLRATLGEALPVATYIVLDEVTADAWGYAGLTQEHRRTPVGQRLEKPTQDD